MVRDYLRELEAKLSEIEPLLEKKEIKIEIISEEVALVKGKIEFLNGSVLDFRELLSPNEFSYRFYWMDDKKELISRWDTAPHHRKVKSFPYHKHTQGGVETSKEKRLLEIIDEIEKELMKVEEK